MVGERGVLDARGGIAFLVGSLLGAKVRHEVVDGLLQHGLRFGALHGLGRPVGRLHRLAQQSILQLHVEHAIGFELFRNCSAPLLRNGQSLLQFANLSVEFVGASAGSELAKRLVNRI